MGAEAYTTTEFSEALASKAPAPGGGGASAYVGALSAALARRISSKSASSMSHLISRWK
jgi:formiminotetrahydrofolate cyclodeaminase